jgi:SAM-dependent methyltransferase
VIDAACADGYGSTMLADVAANVQGFDLDAESIARATRHHATHAVRFAVADVTRMPVPDAACDVVVSFETIEHLPDDRQFLTEVRRVLKPGGLFLCSTPNRELMNPGIGPDGRPFNRFHVREYGIEELRALLSDYFTDVEGYCQSRYAGSYARQLTRIAAWSPMAAVRLHQCRKVLGIPFEHIDKHRPRPLLETGVPEVQIFVSRRREGERRAGDWDS